MKFKLIAISERLPLFDKPYHPLDLVLFYDKNGVKFLFSKKKIAHITKQEWLDQGFTHWLEELND